MARIDTDIAHAAALLKSGELVAIPTETVYGLAANALDATAVSKIFAVKNRPSFNPLIVHCRSVEQAALYAHLTDPRIFELAAEFWPGPLTLLVKRKDTIPDIVTAGQPLVGIRIPNHPLALELLNAIDFPLAAPSANPFGYISPTAPEHVLEQLGDKISYILNGGLSEVGVESSILSFAEETPALLRFGGVPSEKIEQLIGPIHIMGDHATSAPLSPGQLASHYAPRKKLILGNADELREKYRNQNYTLITFSKKYPDIAPEKMFVLSEKGDLHEAAHNIFRVLREADKTDSTLILAEPVPAEGLGNAINDRLKRASA
ncbi:MAG: threonylcarbamoyl-AMP synthase [Bacteroidia bacterium]|nr:threonylcarbamoyl-AMP synthase [Bacteroidia bacterium]